MPPPPGTPPGMTGAGLTPTTPGFTNSVHPFYQSLYQSYLAQGYPPQVASYVVNLYIAAGVGVPALGSGGIVSANPASGFPVGGLVGGPQPILTAGGQSTQPPRPPLGGPAYDTGPGLGPFQDPNFPTYEPVFRPTPFVATPEAPVVRPPRPGPFTAGVFDPGVVQALSQQPGQVYNPITGTWVDDPNFVPAYSPLTPIFLASLQQGVVAQALLNTLGPNLAGFYNQQAQQQAALQQAAQQTAVPASSYSTSSPLGPSPFAPASGTGYFQGVPTGAFGPPSGNSLSGNPGGV